MVSFLMECPQCRATIAKGMDCPDCQWSEESKQVAVATLDSSPPSEAATSNEVTATDPSVGYSDTVGEFTRRERIHTRNYAIFMVLSICTGIFGITTAALWVMVIYRGSVLAFLGIGFMTILTGIVSAMLCGVKKYFPPDLNCPGCEIRLDELGTIEPRCPNCDTQLR